MIFYKFTIDFWQNSSWWLLICTRNIICSRQNKSETPDKWLKMFLCTLLELHICNKGKTNAVSLIQIKVKTITAQKIKFSIKDFFSKCDQIRRKLRIWSHLLNKFLIENLIFCAVNSAKTNDFEIINYIKV